MAFTIYPDAATAALLGIPANEPVPLANGATMAVATPLSGLHGPDPPPNGLQTTFIRISMSNPGSATPPQVELIAVNPGAVTQGLPVTITATSVAAAQGLSDGTNPTDAAAAYFDPPSYGPNVYLLKVVIEIPGTTLKIKITNNTGSARDFVWVVADNDGNTGSGTKQPWVQVTPAALAYTALVNQTATATSQSLQINNRGTGPLTVNNIVPALAAPYVLNPAVLPNSGLPASVDPNPASPRNVVIGFSAPATTGSTAATSYTTDGDTGAVSGSGHNNAFALSATTTKLEVVMVLDDSGSMTATDTTSGSSRWSELASATKLFLNYLAGFGANAGTIGIVKFPGNPNNPPDLTSYDFVKAETIPADFGILTQPGGTIDMVVPVDSTPMDFAIQDVLNAGGPPYFANDATSIANNRRNMLLMSDGAWNVGANPNLEVANLGPKNIVVYAAGYGQAGQVDKATLKTLAGAPTRFYDVDTGAGLSALALAQAFKGVIKAGLTSVNSASDPNGIIFVGQEIRHEVIITGYDTKAVFSLNWDTPNAGLTLQLLTPTCDLITPQTAADTAGIAFKTDARFQMYVVDGSYLRNDGTPSRPRYGTWRMIVSYPAQVIEVARAAATAQSEHYSYDVSTESSLRLDLTVDRDEYFAGDPIVVSAKLTANGLPVTGASAKLSVTAPGQSMDNWLAGIPISEQEYQNAAHQLAGKDAWPVYIKAFAAQLKGFVFTSFPQDTSITMSEQNQSGIYSATVNQTNIPDGHTLYVTATGTTSDGISFRRERSVQVRVGVRPDPAFTLFDIAYDPLQTNPRQLAATVSVTPRDRFGNVILIDPATSQNLLLQAQGATLDPKLTTTFNGTYSSRMTYAPGSTPKLSLTVGGQPVFTGKAVAPVDQLHWVDRVLVFKAGLEGAAGANQHINANDALGDIRTKPPNAFVSLGGYGSLTVEIEGQAIRAQGDDDITVFVEPDDDLRSYLVEALAKSPDDDDDDHNKDDGGTWVVLGTSSGTTSSFGLRQANLKAATALRITDKSGRTRDGSFKPLPTPGVSIRAVGVKSTSSSDGETDTDICIRLNILTPDRQPLGGTVDIEFRPQDGGETMNLRAVDASKTIDVKGLQRFPQVRIYQVTVTPTAGVFKPTSQFLTIPASGFNTVEFIIDDKDKKGRKN